MLPSPSAARSEEHTSELQSRFDLVCRPPFATLFPYTTLFRSLVAVVHPLDGAEHHVLHVDARDLHFGELELDQLEAADRVAPQGAVLRIVDAQGTALLDVAQPQRG